MENFDLRVLTDRQLREKCLYYGLQNVPITKDTRQIIINKLSERIFKESEKKNAIKLRQAQVAAQSFRLYKNLNKNIEKFSLTNRRMNSAKILGANVLQRLRIEFDRKQNKKRWTPKRSSLDCIEEEFIEDTKSEPCQSPRSISSESVHLPSRKRTKTVIKSKASALVLFGTPKEEKSNDSEEGYSEFNDCDDDENYTNIV